MNALGCDRSVLLSATSRTPLKLFTQGDLELLELMDKMLKASLDWINEIAFPNAGFDHPNDENKVKCASRALNKMGIEINKAEVYDYCEQLGMPQDSIEKIVDWYGRPNGLRLKYGMTFSASDLKSIWIKMANK